MPLLVWVQGVRPEKYALLDEQQATYVMPFSRNIPEVVQCKLDLEQSYNSKNREVIRQQSRG